MKVNIGNCNFCPRKGVPIAAGWTTRDKKCCTFCLAKKTAKRLSEKRALKAAQQPVPTGNECFECGSKHGPFDPSHIVGKGAHPELANHPENIVWHCRYPCHDLWENPKDLATRMTMNTYKKKAAFIKKYRKPADYE